MWVKSGKSERGVMLATAVLFLASFSTSAFAATAAVDPSQFNPGTPANSARLGALGQLFTSCNMNRLSTMITAVAQGGKGALPGLSIDAKCDMSDPGVTEEPDCKLLANDADFKKMMAREKKAIAGYSCQKTKIAAINAELSCLSDQASQLTQQLGSLGELYNKNLAEMGQYVTARDAEIADRQTQMGKGNEILNGNPGTGKMGLLAAKAMLDALVTQPSSGDPSKPNSPSDFKAAQKINADMRTQMTELIANRTIGLANDCFQKTTSPSFQCVRNGPPVSATAYAACRFEQNQHLGVNGHRENDATTSATAAGAKNGLQSILDEMASEISVDPNIPMSDADTMKVAAAGGNVIHTPQELAEKYQARLAAYDGKGLKISTFLMNQFQGCYKKAVTKVNVERSQKTSAIGKNQTQIAANEANLSANIYAKIEALGKSYELAMTSLTGSHWPLNTAGCQNAAPAIQASCLDKAFENIRSTSNGQDTKSLTTITLAGANPKSAFSIQCRGLDGCVVSMQAVMRNLNDETNKLNTAKKDYIQKANASTLAFTQKVATSLGPQSQQLLDKQNKLNSALAALGISSPIKLKPVQSESLTLDANGLYKNPTSINNVVGSLMKPPMLDVTGDDFAEAQVSTADKTKEVDTNLGKLTDMLSRLPALRKDCANAAIAKASEGIEDIVDKLAEDCAWSSSFCTDQRKDSVGRLSANLNQILDTGNSQGLETDSGTILASGIRGACPDNPDTETTNQKERCAWGSKADGTFSERQKLQKNYSDATSCVAPVATKPSGKVSATDVSQKQMDELTRKNLCTSNAAAYKDQLDALKETCAKIDKAKDSPRACEAAYSRAEGKARAISTATRNATSSSSGVK